MIVRIRIINKKGGKMHRNQNYLECIAVVRIHVYKVGLLHESRSRQNHSTLA